MHLQQVYGLVHLLDLLGQALHERVVERSGDVLLAEGGGAVGEDGVGVGADEAVVDAWGGGLGEWVGGRD